MRICIDMDGTICETNKQKDYNDFIAYQKLCHKK